MLTIVDLMAIDSSLATAKGESPNSPSPISLANSENNSSGFHVSSSYKACEMSATNSLKSENKPGAPAEPKGSLNSM